MKKSGTFEQESSLSNRSSSSKKQYLDTQEEEATQKKENFGSIFYLSHLIQKIVSIKTSNSFDMILCSMRSHRKLQDGIKKLHQFIVRARHQLKVSCISKLKEHKYKESVKQEGFILTLNGIKRAGKRKKLEAFTSIKNSFLKYLHGEKVTLSQENKIFLENIFSDGFIKEVKRISRLNPQTNFNTFSQSIQPLLLLLPEELSKLQNQRKRKTQAGNNQAIIHVMNSLASSLFTLKQQQKNMLTETKQLKKISTSAKQMATIMQQIKKMDMEIEKNQNSQNQFKKVLENQMKTLDKKKGISYLFESRKFVLNLTLKYFNNQKQDPSKELISDKLQYISYNCYKPAQLQSFKTTLKPLASVSEKSFLTIINALTRLQQQQGKKQSKIHEKKQYQEMIAQILNLGKILQRLIQGKLFQSGKQHDWSNLFKPNNQKFDEINIFYGEIGRIFEIIEQKNKKINQLEHVLGNIIKTMNQHQEGSAADFDCESLMELDENKRSLLKKMSRSMEIFSNPSQKNEQVKSISNASLNDKKSHDFDEQFLMNKIKELEIKIQKFENQKNDFKLKEQYLLEQLEKKNKVISELENKIDKLKKKNEEKSKTVEEVKTEYHKFEQIIKDHQFGFLKKKKEVSLLMKSPNFTNSNSYSAKKRIKTMMSNNPSENQNREKSTSIFSENSNIIFSKTDITLERNDLTPKKSFGFLNQQRDPEQLEITKKKKYIE